MAGKLFAALQGGHICGEQVTHWSSAVCPRHPRTSVGTNLWGQPVRFARRTRRRSLVDEGAATMIGHHHCGDSATWREKSKWDEDNKKMVSPIRN